MRCTRTKKLTASLRASVMPEEKLQFAALAETSGSTLSQWIRKVLQDRLTDSATPKRRNTDL